MEIIEQSETRLVYRQKQKQIRIVSSSPSTSQVWSVVAIWCSIGFACAFTTEYLRRPDFWNIGFVTISILSIMIFWKLHGWLFDRRMSSTSNGKSFIHVVFDLTSDEVIINLTFNGKQSTFSDSLKQFCDVKVILYSKFDEAAWFEVVLAYVGRAMRVIYHSKTREEGELVAKRIRNFIESHLSPCPETQQVVNES